MTQELIKKAIGEAEKDHQEKLIKNIKNIVIVLLNKIDEKKKQKDKIDDEISLLKRDLDDLKAGRLDKIFDRQENDRRHDEISPLRVDKFGSNYIPLKPWHSSWHVSVDPDLITTNLFGTVYGSGWTTGLITEGINFSNFVGGTYTLNGQIINL